jgi:hypothetical protein
MRHEGADKKDIRVLIRQSKDRQAANPFRARTVGQGDRARLFGAPSLR